MRKLLLIPLSVVLLFCAASKPPAVDAKKHDEIYQTMIKAYVAQVNFYAVAMSNGSLSELVQVQQNKEKAIGDWQAMVSRLQKENHTEKCSLNIDLTWACPPPDAAKK